MPENFQLKPGQSVQSETGVWYRVVQHLGTGGNAITYLANATSGPNKGVPFAVKVFRKLFDQERRERFLEEVRILRGIRHPSIMQVYDSGTFRMRVEAIEHNHPFVVAEYLPRTLYHAIRANELSMPAKVSVSLQLLSSLNFLAQRGPQIVHRDIKPQNIFIKGRSCVLGDFGLLKILDGNDELDREIFKLSIGPGMPFFYRTPDLVAYANNEADISVKSDVFQLGLVLAELFSGQNPCVRPDKILDPVELAQIRHIPGAFGAGIAALLKRMLAMNPAEREPVDSFFDPFFGVFNEMAQLSIDLEERVI